jgi:hypothetical protein
LRSTSTLVDLSVSDGALNLEREPGAPPPFFERVHNNAELAVAQSGLVGDFDVTIEWEDFQPGGSMLLNGPRIGAGLVWQDETSTFYVAHADVMSGTASARVYVPDEDLQIVFLDPTPDPASLVGASGSFRFQRTAGILSTITTVNSQSARAESEQLVEHEPFTLFICIGDPDESGAGPASIKISGVTVTGGGGVVKSDDFSCQ